MGATASRVNRALYGRNKGPCGTKEIGKRRNEKVAPLLNSALCLLIIGAISGGFTGCRKDKELTLPINLIEKSEIICQKETGYLPTRGQIPRGPCYSYLKDYLDSELKKKGEYPKSIDSIVEACKQICFPLEVERKILYTQIDFGKSFRVDSYLPAELDSFRVLEKNRLANSEETNMKYRVCLERESKKRWEEFRDKN
jgi:hypothetical protein